MARPVPTAGEKVVKAEWVREAVRLSTRGRSLRWLGERYGVSHETVRKALLQEFERVRPSLEEIEALRERHLEKLEARESRLNRLVGAYWKKARTGDAEAAKVVLDAEKGLDRVHVSQAKLCGLDAPTRSEYTGADGAPLLIDTSGLSTDELAKLLAATEPGAEGDDSGATEDGTGEAD